MSEEAVREGAHARRVLREHLRREEERGHEQPGLAAQSRGAVLPEERQVPEDVLGPELREALVQLRALGSELREIGDNKDAKETQHAKEHPQWCHEGLPAHAACQMHAIGEHRFSTSQQPALAHSDLMDHSISKLLAWSS